ncbi:MAG: 16S rRNA (uracil(1498)-N(3))-methyltransferase [Treponema sp.]|nr:16S rRNA (uracil(1498)-N(3))-methyltransferase [Treponema sp.]MCL2237887.1 16S rRNA (uracil(1498)-N(3))-methyltransferase [Treponema sp.]
MKQFLLNREPDRDGLVRLDGSDYRYLIKVRRLATGEIFTALLPNGDETQVQVIAIDGSTLTVKCEAGEAGEPLNNTDSHPQIILFQALPKGDKMDLIVRQAAEGGIAQIVPFVSAFSVAKTGAGGQKFSRWEKIIKEARQQSGSKIATSLHVPMSIEELFDYWKKFREEEKEGTAGILFHHREIENSPKKGLEQKSLHGYLNNDPKIVTLAIGPEGGFSDKEAALFMENGFKPITIGDTILRTETAALYCAAAIRVLLLEKDSWEMKQPK